MARPTDTRWVRSDTLVLDEALTLRIIQGGIIAAILRSDALFH